MGTVFNRVPGILEPILEALRGEPVNVIVTVGPNADPERLGPLPGHVHVERYIPHSAILPRVDVVVSHAGYNTIIATLVHGKPMLALPVGDQNSFYNAFRLAACGAGLQLDARQMEPERVRSAINALLSDPLYCHNAERLRREICALPPVEVALPLLERLAGGTAPAATATRG
jgi:MGT family glycosyltransferase